MKLTLEDISSTVARTVSDYNVREAYLFGSFARGEQVPGSDIDLRLLCGPTMDYGALYEISCRLEDALGCAVEIVTNPPQRMRLAFRERIMKDEALLYAAA